MTVLEFRGVTFGYRPDQPLIQNLTFAVKIGELLVLMGRSGSGKSTVARLASGLLTATAGHVRSEPAGYVAQDPEEQIIGESVEEEVSLGLPFGFSHDASPRPSDGLSHHQESPGTRAARRVQEALETVGMAWAKGRALRTLSGGELQRVALAAALVADRRLLILDEPTAHLSAADADRFWAALRSALALRRCGALLITHDPRAARLARRVIVLSEGRVAAAGPTPLLLGQPRLLAELALRPENPRVTRPHAESRAARGGDSTAGGGSQAHEREPVRVREPMWEQVWDREPVREREPAWEPIWEREPVRKRVRDREQAWQREQEQERAGAEEDLLTFEGVRVDYAGRRRREKARSIRPALDHLSLRVRSGEAVACLGPSGAGKSTLLLAAAGLIPYTGTIRIAGRSVREAARRDPKWFHAQVGLALQFPERSFFAATVRDELSFTARLLGRRRAQIERSIEESLALVGLSPTLLSASPFALSGGERRRLALATVVAHGPRLLLLDEPDSGLDWPGKLLVAALINRLKGEGKGVVVVTHDGEWAASFADRSLTLMRGRWVEERPAAEGERQ